MVKKDDLIRRLREFVSAVSAKVGVKAVFLFGSRASGRPRKDSDVDLVIVSPSFRGKKFHQRASRLHDLWSIDLPVDFLCLTPEEFEEKKHWVSSVAGIASRTGIRIV